MSRFIRVTFGPSPADHVSEDSHNAPVYAFPGSSDTPSQIDDLQALRDNFGILLTAVRKRFQYGYGDGADDVLSTLFLGFLKARRSFNPSRGARFSTYAFTVVSNALADLGRFEEDSSALIESDLTLENQGEGERSELEALVSYEEPGFDASETYDMRMCVRSFVRLLPPRQRQAAHLVFWEDLTPADAARKLGISRAAVNELLAKIRARGKEVLAAYDPTVEAGRLAA
jgi:RNA polymerase sigma factor (sigma-70 family)